MNELPDNIVLLPSIYPTNDEELAKFLIKNELRIKKLEWSFDIIKSLLQFKLFEKK